MGGYIELVQTGHSRSSCTLVVGWIPEGIGLLWGFEDENWEWWWWWWISLSSSIPSEYDMHSMLFNSITYIWVLIEKEFYLTLGFDSLGLWFFTLVLGFIWGWMSREKNSKERERERGGFLSWWTTTISSLYFSFFFLLLFWFTSPFFNIWGVLMERERLLGKLVPWLIVVLHKLFNNIIIKKYVTLSIYYSIRIRFFSWYLLSSS